MMSKSLKAMIFIIILVILLAIFKEQIVAAIGSGIEYIFKQIFNFLFGKILNI